ncbi:hypothetical protein LCGC14_1603990 [marine sediment metagenome]|uniref:Uncharacterized protein n=1 Tax=marine sediment metagenome TaxID=412755 RepID=A0A0F9IAP5_9ZZZZ
MIANCPGCEQELFEIEKWVEEGLHFAGCGLYERGHLLMIMVNDKGEVIVG